MAGCCVTYLFFSYAAASVIYLIIGIFATTGNIAVLAENFIKVNDSYIDPEEKKQVKSRTLAQYFLASGISVIIAILLFFLCIIRKPKGYTEVTQQREKITEEKQNVVQIEEDDEEDNNNINTKGEMPIELAKQTRDYDSAEGMKETIN